MLSRVLVGPMGTQGGMIDMNICNFIDTYLRENSMTNHAAGAAAMGLGVIFFMVSVGICLLVAWIASILDVLKNEYDGDNTKTIWILILVLMAPLGTILYQLIGKKQKLNNSQNNPSLNVKIKTAIKQKPIKNAAKPNITPIKTDTCSQCGSAMKERTVMSGEKSGQKFLVCVKYPTCKFILPLEIEM